MTRCGSSSQSFGSPSLRYAGQISCALHWSVTLVRYTRPLHSPVALVRYTRPLHTSVTLVRYTRSQVEIKAARKKLAELEKLENSKKVPWLPCDCRYDRYWKLEYSRKVTHVATNTSWQM